jgi:diazepam-binding inhibitor (GABA receptor modulating acyl-CoA-binding protein)
MSIENQFKEALAYVQSQSDGGEASKLSNDVKLKFYALYKQIAKGPNKEKAPSRLNVVARAKWAAWNELKDMSKERAMEQYISTLLQTDPKFREKFSVKIRSKL